MNGFSTVQSKLEALPQSVLKARSDCFVCGGRGVSVRWLKVKNLAMKELI